LVGAALPLLRMDNQNWTIKTKPYDLRVRLFRFACLTTRLAQFLQTRGRVAAVFSEQLLRSGTSAGANYEEADDGSSRRDRNAKRRIVLRELKETSFRLRVLRETGILMAVHDPVIEECAELVKIVATVIRKTRPDSPKSGGAVPAR
jgi:four helix bundle protein